mgnify:CR=1 FL=1
MKHIHQYETAHRPTLTEQVEEHGIKAAEMRRCRVCEKQMPFVLTKQGWFPLFEDREVDEKEILLA